jgi:hypothetical protein
VIRAVLHPLNDQPLVVDLVEAPKPADIALICTNVRTLEGRRPTFIDHSSSTFVFPYAGIRFVEIPSGEAPAREAAQAAAEPDELEIDEAFLQRVRDA